MKTTTRLALFLPILLSFWACQPKENNNSDEMASAKSEEKTIHVAKYNKPAPANDFVAQIEKAHTVKTVFQKEAVAFDLELHFGGKLRAEGTVSMLANSGKIKLDMKDGTTVLFDGKDTYLIPKTSEYAEKKARFDIFTWQYFFALPYKLSDPGTVWEVQGKKSLNGIDYETGKLSFGENIGDAPDDWYLVYRNELNQIYAAAYIVTFSSSADKAASDPHAITYENYTEVEGVPFATDWKFWGWTEEKGLTDQLGFAKLTNIKFLTAKEAGFEVPADAKKIEMPESE